MRFSERDIRTFADWSGDCNPLHVDPAFARSTPYGQPIAHGMLSVLGALDAAAPEALDQVGTLDVEFRGAVLADTEYDVRATHVGADGQVRPSDRELHISVQSPDAVVLNIRATLDGASEPEYDADWSWVRGVAARNSSVDRRHEPAHPSTEELERRIEVAGTYRPRAAADASGAATTGGRRHLRAVLGLCSYIVGMELPGLRSLFTAARIQFARAASGSRIPDPGSRIPAHASTGASEVLCYRARVRRFDRNFRILDVDVDVATIDGQPVANAAIRSYVPFGTAAIDVDALASQLSPSTTRLQGAVAFVCGGSRGLGLEISAALALAGCHVYVGARSGAEQVATLRERLQQRGCDLEFVEGDAGDPAWCQQTIERIQSTNGRLDVLVLNACSAPNVIRIAPDAFGRQDEYVRQNLRLVQAPLAASLEALDSSGGALVYISSSFVTETPAGFGHYAALKQAGEAVVRTAQRERPGTTALIARPPRLQTSWNDTPTGAAGAIPSAWAALHVVNRLAESWQSARVDVLSEFPPLAPVAATSTTFGSGSVDKPAFPVRVCATFTIDPLLRGLRFWLQELGLADQIESAPYGQVLQTLLDPKSLFARRGGVNVVLLRVRDWLRELPPEKAESIEFLRGHLQEMARDVERAMRAHRSRAGAETLLVICPSYGAASSAENILLRQTETDLAASLQGTAGLRVVSAADYHARYGVNEDDAGDPVREKLAHVPYRDAYYHVLATIVMRHAHRGIARRRKVVVVDCDNTLWRGVVGEAGPEGLELDESHLALHDKLNELTGGGLLLCLCSKNEESDVWRVFETRADLRLRRETIVASAINWRPKSENLRALASRLNLGLDSFIFIDDNPVECAEVRARCPEVLTLQWPLESREAVQFLNHAWELDSADATKEDERRTQMYREEFQRQEFRDESLSFADFISSLALDVDITPLADADLRRASQLTFRTNQFNFTTRRRNESELQALRTREGYDIFTVRVRDRFGDYGLVGLLITEVSADVLAADTFLLSCRVLGRGVEHRMAAQLGRVAQERQLRTVRMRVASTERNAPARQFLETIAPSGVARIDEAAVECDFPSDGLANLRFEPTQQPGYVPGQADGEAPSADSASSSSLREATGHERRREAQILRAAYELHDVAALTAIIDRDAAAPSEVATGAGANRAIESAGIERDVCDAFARALHISSARVKEIDRLDALGCDSMKIVDITVALLEKYPSLPTTLLFEQRSVSAIVEQIAAISNVGADLPVRPGGPHIGAGLQRHVGAGLQARPGEQVRPTAGYDIAVVGLHLRCAGAQSPDELWELLSNGRTAVREVKPNRKDFLSPLVDDRQHWAGLLDEVSQFDAEFFGISPREAELMDPQLRLFLEVAWAALEDAGCTDTDHEPNTGVFAGVMYGDYGYKANVAAKLSGNPYRSWEGFSLANRLSQILSFRGPSLAVDTACSSSGTALHLACRALDAGDCRVAIVGGINLILDADRFGSLGRLGILSSRGKCEPFGADADGTVLGEGAGVVVLRPLSDALARGDRIYGVIKGTGISTGSGTVGFTAPNPQAQAEAIERAVRAAAVDPRTITYVETHGTGTVLGDPIEVRGLTLAYGQRELHDSQLQIAPQCRIGSIKPNIGHLEAGAGILGLIKVLLQLERGALLPSITSETPNPHIPFRDVPFDVQRTLGPWTRTVANVNGIATTVPRRAGLSSFGVGGANAHVIIEEPPAHAARERSMPDRPAHVLTLSARNREALRQQAAHLVGHLQQHPDLDVADICFTGNVRRKHFEHRLAFPVTGREQLLSVLDDTANGRERAGVIQGQATAEPRGKIAFLFTGQGSQYAGMGRALYKTQPVFRDALNRCAAIFDRLLEQPLLDLLFADEHTPEAELLNQTGFTQPALFAFEYALSELWASWGVRPDFVLGHSVGELAAMCVAGGMSLDDGLKLIAARGRLMQALPPGGTMTSVMAAERRVQEAIAGCEDRVAIAAINAPGQVVISGAGVAVAEIAARLEADGIRTKALIVSHAFHSPLMQPMVAEYEAVVRQIAFRRPHVPFVSCVDGVLAADQVTTPEYWIRNVTDPVRFTTGMQVLEAQGVTTYIEIGPLPVLVGMGRQCIANTDAAYTWLPSMRKDVDPWQTMLASLARLHVDGVPIDWSAFDAPYARRTVPLPPYAFNRKRYWLRSLDVRSDAPPVSITRGAADEIDADEFLREADEQHSVGVYELAWRPQPLGVQQAAPATASNWLIFADRSGVGARLAESLRATGARATLVLPTEELTAGAFASALTNASSSGQPPSVVYLWGLDATSSESSSHVAGLLHLTRAMADAPAGSRSRLWVVTRNAVAVDSKSSHLAVPQAMLWGFGRTVSLEEPDIWGGLIDVGSEADVPALTRELSVDDTENQIALRGDVRYVARLERRSNPTPKRLTLDPAGTYLVTGGLGALGLQVAERLVARGARHLALASRRAPGEAADRAIRSLKQRGAEVVISATDVTRAEDIDRLLRTIAAGSAPLKGIVHAAGIDATVPIRSMAEADLDAVLAPKARGAWLLHERTRDASLDFFVCFSSMAAVLGAQGRAHYGAANAFLDALAAERRRAGVSSLSVAWGPWRGGGMADGEQLARFERVGNYGLEPQDALETLEHLMESRAAQAMVADVDWPQFVAAYEARRPQPVVSTLRSMPGSARSARSEKGDANARAASAVSPWIAALLEVPETEREKRLTELLRAEAAATLGFDSANDVPIDRKFSALGMDSLMMAEFIGRLVKRVGTSCTALVFEHPTVQALAPRLLEAIAASLGAQVAAVHVGSFSSEHPEIATRPTSGMSGYSTAEDAELLAFHSEVFPDRRPECILPRWHWMFGRSAMRLGCQPQAWLYRDGGRIVGHMGAIAVRLKIGSGQRDTAWLVDTMVLESHRRDAIGSRLMVQAHEDFACSLSLGQSPEMRDIQFRLGWQQVAPLKIAQLLIRPENVLRQKVGRSAAWAAGLGLRASVALRGVLRNDRRLDIREVDRFTDRHDALWEAMSKDVVCAVVRDASYLNWKYVEQPAQTFLRLELSHGHDLRGVAVLMFREPDSTYSYRRAFLVDLVAPLRDRSLLEELVYGVSLVAEQRGADSLMSMHTDRRVTRALKACGFVLRSPQRFLLIDAPQLPPDELALMSAEDNWYVTQGDSDIDRPGAA